MKHFTAFSLLVLALILTLGFTSVAVAATYYSQGSVTPNTTTNWNTVRAGGGSSPANFTSGDIFVVQSPHSMTTTGTWTVSGTGAEIQIESGGTLTCANTTTTQRMTVLSGGLLINNSGITLTVNNGNAGGADLDVTGTYRNAGTTTYGASATGIFNSGGKYQHNFTTTSGTIPTATWSSGSTCEIIGYTSNTSVPGGLIQSFSNFTWNCTSQTGNLNTTANLTTVNGDLTVTSTGSGSWRWTGTTTDTLVVGGNFVQTGGTFDMANGSNTVAKMKLTGNFNQTGGTIQQSGTGSTRQGIIIFNGTTQSITASGTIGTHILWKVNSGSTVTLLTNVSDPTSGYSVFTVNGILECGTFAVTGAGDFVLSSTGTLRVGSADGINSGTSVGNIRVSGTRTLGNASSSIVYNGGVAQVTGNGLPASIGHLTVDNTSGVSSSQSLTVNGTLTLTNGTFAVGTTTLTLNSTVTATSGGLSSSASGTVSYAQTPGTGQTILAANYGNLTLNSVNKVFPSSGTVGIAGTFTPGSTSAHTVTGSTIDFNGSGSQTISAFNYNNLTSSSSGGRTLASSGTVGVAGVFTKGTNAYTITGSTIDYNGSGSQDIIAFNYNNLTSSSSGARVLASSGTVGVAGMFTPGSNSYTNTGSTVDFNGSGSQTIPAFNYNNLTSSSSGARTLASSGTIGVAETFTPGTNSYTITGSTIDFNGSGSQTIPAFNYNNLTSSSSGTRTLASSGTVGIAGTFTQGTRDCPVHS